MKEVQNEFPTIYNTAIRFESPTRQIVASGFTVLRPSGQLLFETLAHKGRFCGVARPRFLLQQFQQSIRQFVRNRSHAKMVIRFIFMLNTRFSVSSAQTLVLFSVAVVPV